MLVLLNSIAREGREEGKWEATPALENIGDRFGETWGDSDVSRSRAASGTLGKAGIPEGCQGCQGFAGFLPLQ